MQYDESIHRLDRDALTLLPNRAAVERRLEHIISTNDEATTTSTAIMFLGVDRFKVVNDGMGHAAGDSLLVAIADRLQCWAVASHRIISPARFDGDEFVIVCEHLDDMNEMMDLADQALQLFRQPFHIGSRQLFVTASIGVAEVSGVRRPATGGGLDDRIVTATGILRDADAAMHCAKARGRDGIEVADDALRAKASARLELETALHHALERDEFCLHYQPIVDLNTDRTVGYEALIRWNHPHQGMIPPDSFIPFAEDNGLIVPIGRWVLREAARQLAEWRVQPCVSDTMADVFMAVNVSTVQLFAGDFAHDLIDVLADTGLPADALHIEITETALMDVDRAVPALNILHAIGVHIDLDDFGTGYSSLSYLQKLPIDTIKLDQSFIVGLGHPCQNGSIVEAVIALGRALGRTVLAEGVEMACQRDHLRGMGCRLAQGYLWARPMPGDRVPGHHARSSDASGPMRFDRGAEQATSDLRTRSTTS